MTDKLDTKFPKVRGVKRSIKTAVAVPLATAQVISNFPPLLQPISSKHFNEFERNGSVADDLGNKYDLRFPHLHNISYYNSLTTPNHSLASVSDFSDSVPVTPRHRHAPELELEANKQNINSRPTVGLKEDSIAASLSTSGRISYESLGTPSLSRAAKTFDILNPPMKSMTLSEVEQSNLLTGKFSVMGEQVAPLPCRAQYATLSRWQVEMTLPEVQQQYFRVMADIVVREGALLRAASVIRGLDNQYWKYAVMRIKSVRLRKPANTEKLCSKRNHLLQLQQEVVVAVAHLRAASIAVVEAIVKLRKLCKAHLQTKYTISIFWENRNYLHKMTRDITPLTNFPIMRFWVGFHANPFMVPPLQYNPRDAWEVQNSNFAHWRKLQQRWCLDEKKRQLEAKQKARYSLAVTSSVTYSSFATPTPTPTTSSLPAISSFSVGEKKKGQLVGDGDTMLGAIAEEEREGSPRKLSKIDENSVITSTKSATNDEAEAAPCEAFGDAHEINYANAALHGEHSGVDDKPAKKFDHHSQSMVQLPKFPASNLRSVQSESALINSEHLVSLPQPGTVQTDAEIENDFQAAFGVELLSQEPDCDSVYQGLDQDIGGMDPCDPDADADVDADAEIAAVVRVGDNDEASGRGSSNLSVEVEHHHEEKSLDADGESYRAPSLEVPELSPARSEYDWGDDSDGGYSDDYSVGDNIVDFACSTSDAWEAGISPENFDNKLEQPSFDFLNELEQDGNVSISFLNEGSTIASSTDGRRHNTVVNTNNSSKNANWKLLRSYCIRAFKHHKQHKDFWNDMKHAPAVVEAAIGFEDVFPNFYIIPPLPNRLRRRILPLERILEYEVAIYKKLDKEFLAASHLKRHVLANANQQKIQNIIYGERKNQSAAEQAMLRLRQETDSIQPFGRTVVNNVSTTAVGDFQNSFLDSPFDAAQDSSNWGTEKPIKADPASLLFSLTAPPLLSMSKSEALFNGPRSVDSFGSEDPSCYTVGSRPLSVKRDRLGSFDNGRTVSVRRFLARNNAAVQIKTETRESTAKLKSGLRYRKHCAQIIQALARGYIQRRKFKLQLAHHRRTKAAIMIQRIVRGRLGRIVAKECFRQARIEVWKLRKYIMQRNRSSAVISRLFKAFWQARCHSKSLENLKIAHERKQKKELKKKLNHLIELRYRNATARVAEPLYSHHGNTTRRMSNSGVHSTTSASVPTDPHASTNSGHNSAHEVADSHKEAHVHPHNAGAGEQRHSFHGENHLPYHPIPHPHHHHHDSHPLPPGHHHRPSHLIPGHPHHHPDQLDSHGEGRFSIPASPRQHDTHRSDSNNLHHLNLQLLGPDSHLLSHRTDSNNLHHVSAHDSLVLTHRVDSNQHHHHLNPQLLANLHIPGIILSARAGGSGSRPLSQRSDAGKISDEHRRPSLKGTCSTSSSENVSKVSSLDFSNLPQELVQPNQILSSSGGLETPASSGIASAHFGIAIPEERSGFGMMSPSRRNSSYHTYGSDSPHPEGLVVQTPHTPHTPHYQLPIEHEAYPRAHTDENTPLPDDQTVKLLMSLAITADVSFPREHTKAVADDDGVQQQATLSQKSVDTSREEKTDDDTLTIETESNNGAPGKLFENLQVNSPAKIQPRIKLYHHKDTVHSSRLIPPRVNKKPHNRADDEDDEVQHLRHFSAPTGRSFLNEYQSANSLVRNPNDLYIPPVRSKKNDSLTASMRLAQQRKNAENMRSALKFALTLGSPTTPSSK